MKKKEKNKLINIYTLLLSTLVIIGLISYLLPKAQFDNNTIVNGSGVVRSTISSILKSPFEGIAGCLELIIFVACFGGFIKVIDKTNTVEKKIFNLAKKIKNKDLLIVPISLLLFTVLGILIPNYNFLIVFIIIFTAFSLSVGYDALLGIGIPVVGFTSGTLIGLTSPWSLYFQNEIQNNKSVLLFSILLSLFLLLLAAYFFYDYILRVKKSKKNSILSEEEKDNIEIQYDEFVLKTNTQNKKTKLTENISTILFILTYIVLIVGFIPWEQLNITCFSKFSGWLTGTSLGKWGLLNASIWLLLISALIAYINDFKKKDYFNYFVDGIKDTIKIIIVIALIQAIFITLNNTYLNNYIVFSLARWVQTLPKGMNVVCNYFLHFIASLLIPASEISNYTNTIIINSKFGTDLSILIFSSADLLAKLFIPTCIPLITCLMISKVNYKTWLRFIFKLIISILIISLMLLLLFAFFLK